MNLLMNSSLPLAALAASLACLDVVIFRITFSSIVAFIG